MPIISLEELLKSGSGSALDDMVQTAQHMDELTTRLRRELDPDLADNLIAASLREDSELVLVASSSAWAAKLRFEAEMMMDVASRSGNQVESCRVVVSKHTR